MRCAMLHVLCMLCGGGSGGDCVAGWEGHLHTKTVNTMDARCAVLCCTRCVYESAHGWVNQQVW